MMCAWFIFGAYVWVGERGQSVMVMQTWEITDSGGGMDKQQQSIRREAAQGEIFYSLFLNLQRSTYGIVCSLCCFCSPLTNQNDVPLVQQPQEYHHLLQTPRDNKKIKSKIIMPSTVDEDSNPFEELLENNNLPDAAIPPALPPLPIQEQQDYHQAVAHAAAQEEVGGGEFVTLPEGGSASAAVANGSEMMTTPPTMPTKVTKSYKSTLLFKTDLTKSARDIHPCGILHFTRSAPHGSGSEEHAFAWIQHHNVPSHVSSILGHMNKFGFDPKDVTFIPYSSRRSWIDRYPLAFPHVHCGDNGIVTGFPYWSAEACSATGDVAAGRMMMLTNNNSGSLTTVDGTSVATQQPVVQQRGRKKKKIFPTAHLANDERDELHIEIFKYFQWLQDSIIANATGVPGGAVGEAGGGGLDVDDNGDDDGDKKPAAQFTYIPGGANAAGSINPVSLQTVMDAMSSTFKVVRNAQPGSSLSGSHSMPFLEEALSDPLSKLAAAAKRDPQARASRTKRSRGLDFDDMYNRLMRFQQVRTLCIFRCVSM